MILPTLKEEQILNELLTDYAEVKHDVRKTVKKRQRAAQKRGHTIRNGSVEVLTTRTKNGNNWVCCVYYERDRTASWNLSACCEAEGEKGRKDYYLLRGLSDQPYYIKLTSHAVRRYKEQYKVYIHTTERIKIFRFRRKSSYILDAFIKERIHCYTATIRCNSTCKRRLIMFVYNMMFQISHILSLPPVAFSLRISLRWAIILSVPLSVMR